MSQLPIVGTTAGPNPGPKAGHLTLAGAQTDLRYLKPVSPMDRHPLEPVAMATPAEIRAAVERARIAQTYWQRDPFEKRAQLLGGAAKELLQRRAEVISLARAEMGKVAAEGLFNEALGPLETMRGWIKIVERHGRSGVLRCRK